MDFVWDYLFVCFWVFIKYFHFDGMWAPGIYAHEFRYLRRSEEEVELSEAEIVGDCEY